MATGLRAGSRVEHCWSRRASRKSRASMRGWGRGYWGGEGGEGGFGRGGRERGEMRRGGRGGGREGGREEGGGEDSMEMKGRKSLQCSHWDLSAGTILRYVQLVHLLL